MLQSVIISNRLHIRYTVVFGLTLARLGVNLSELEGGHAHLPERMNLKLGRLVYFPGYLRLMHTDVTSGAFFTIYY